MRRITGVVGAAILMFGFGAVAVGMPWPMVVGALVVLFVAAWGLDA